MGVIEDEGRLQLPLTAVNRKESVNKLKDAVLIILQIFFTFVSFS